MLKLYFYLYINIPERVKNRNVSLCISVEYDMEEISYYENVMIYAGKGSHGEEMDKNGNFAKRRYLIREDQYRVRRV